MDRRQFVKSSVATAIAASALPAAAQAQGSRPRYNVLYVFDDQHRFQSFPGPDNDSPKGAQDKINMPNLAQFRANNISMDTCVSTYPLCAPARGMLITGVYPYVSGITHNGITLQPSTDFTAMPQFFTDSGYNTCYVGKWHLSSDTDAKFVPSGNHRFGVKQWHVWCNTDDHTDDGTCHTWNPDTGAVIDPKNDPYGWNPSSMTAQATQFLDNQAASVQAAQSSGGTATPWMMVVSWNPPHPDWDPPAAYSQGDGVGPTYRPNVPAFPQPSNPTPWMQTADMYDEQAGLYFGNITGIDNEFNTLMQSLKSNNFLENTIVIFSSDHGELLGSHGCVHKHWPYEESCRVPFIVQYPGAGAATRTSAISTVDIYPTLCGLVGLTPPALCAGLDLSDHVLGAANPANTRQYAFLMSQDTTAQYMNEEELHCPPYRGLREHTPDGKSFTYTVNESGRWMLFDNVADAYQMTNYFDDNGNLQQPYNTQAIQQQIARYDTALNNWMSASKDPYQIVNGKMSRDS